MTIAEPRYVDGEAMLVAGLGLRFDADTRSQLPALWQRFGKDHFGRVPGQVGGATYGVCHNFSRDMTFDYLAGVEVESLDGLPKELARLSIAASHYAVFRHAGHVSELGPAWMAIFQDWLPKSAETFEGRPCFERYGEGFDPKSGRGGMEIWVAVK